MGFEMDFLGIYATYESLIPQIVVLVVIIVISVVYAKQNKKQRAQIEAEKAKLEQK